MRDAHRSVAWWAVVALVVLGGLVLSTTTSQATTTTSMATTTTLQPQATSLTPGLHQMSVVVQSRDRTFIVFVPSRGIAASRPLMLVYHGAGGSASNSLTTTDFESVAQQDGFVVAYLQGYDGSWNDGLPDTPANAAGVNDVSYTADVIAKLEASLVFNHKKIAAVGLSNGAEMAEYLGCHLAREVTMIAPVEGQVNIPLTKACPRTVPISVFEVHGTADAVFPYNGGPFQSAFGGGSTVLSAKASVKFWAKRDACDRTPKSKVRSASETLLTYSGCQAKTSVVLDTINGGTHEWPANIAALVDRALGS
jgi:polyhydroxybutyrate depolymerase